MCEGVIFLYLMFYLKVSSASAVAVAMGEVVGAVCTCEFACVAV
jgi:hypothetical protein